MTNASIADSSWAQFFRKIAGMSSGPDDYLALMFPSRFVSPALETKVRGIYGYGEVCLVGMLDESSRVKTEQNLSFSMLAFCRGSVATLPSATSVLTPQLSCRRPFRYRHSFLVCLSIFFDIAYQITNVVSVNDSQALMSLLPQLSEVLLVSARVRFLFPVVSPLFLPGETTGVLFHPGQLVSA